MDLRTRVRAFIEGRALLQAGESLILGVSGGPDSLCLLDLLHSLAGDLTLTLHVAHLNHGLRQEAAAEADFVRAEAGQRGLAFHTETVATRVYAQVHRKSIEEAARELRYDFLTRAALAAGARTIAVAHNADDQAETVLMHFLRGSGLAGLRGMLPKSEIGSWKLEVGTSNLQLPTSNLQLVRPLLAIPRADIEAYCAGHGLHPMRDATNQDATYFRNRLRHALLPQLESYNPNIRAVLQRTAEVMAGEYELLRGRTEALWTAAARLDGGRVTFDRAGWLAFSVPEQRALLREAVHRLRPDRRDVDFTPLERAVHFSRAAQPGRSCDLLGGLRVCISYLHLTVSAWDDDGPVPDHFPLVAEDGQLASGWAFCAETLGPGEWSLDAAAANSAGWEVCVDAARMRTPPRVRARLRGERFHPLGLAGHSVKVSDFMINAKVEAPLRDRWPLVVSGDEIVWLAGLRPDERFKVTAATKTVMRLWFEHQARRPISPTSPQKGKTGRMGG